MIQIDNLTESQVRERVVQQFPAGKFLLNYSGGYPDERITQFQIDHCKMVGCTADDVGMRIELPLSRAYDAADWIGLTSNRWNDFLLAVAAGNENDTSVDPGTAIYPGLGVAAFDAGMAVATLLPDDAFLSDGPTWNGQGAVPGLPNLTASGTDIGAFRQYILASGASAVGPEDNVLIVGSTKPGLTIDALEESAFSDSLDVHGLHGPDVFAVGEHIFTLDTDGFEDGTSFSAPQVAGLASYVWLLSPTLRNAPAATTRTAVVANIRGIGVIDAYASVLSLDAAELPTPSNAPVRLAILDADDNGKFDEADLSTFLDKIFTGEETQDYSRYDLNGDGFTGGPTIERFDLDRVGSSQFGATLYSTVTQSIEGETISFVETHLTDLQILCYYAYSALYTGDPDMRKQLTAGNCTVSVTIAPAAVTLAPGGSQQFSATVNGTADPRVTWNVVSGDGTISTTGLFTAGQTAGSATVRATSVADPKVFGEATVTVRAACGFAGNPVRLHLTIGNRGKDPNPIVIDAESASPALSDSAEGADFMDSATVREGFIQLAARDDNTAAAFPGSPALAFGEFDDEFIVNPTDPALQGTAASMTISVRVTASSDVSGDRARTFWNLNSTFPFQGLDHNGNRSTIAGQTSGDLSGGTYTVTAPIRLGAPTPFAVQFSASVNIACAANEPCPPPSLTGAGHIDAMFQWLGITDVRDQMGNAAAFTVCSASGANWAGTP